MWSLWKVQRSWLKECEALNLGSPTPWTQNSHHEATKPHSHKRTRQVVEINISLSYYTFRKSLPYDIWTEAHFALWMRISPYLVCIHLYTATLYNPYTNIHFLKGSRLLKGEGVKEWLSTQAIPRWHNNGRTNQDKKKARTRCYVLLLLYSGHWFANWLPMEGGVASALHTTTAGSHFIGTTFNFIAHIYKRGRWLSAQFEHLTHFHFQKSSQALLKSLRMMIPRVPGDL